MQGGINRRGTVKVEALVVNSKLEREGDRGRSREKYGCAEEREMNVDEVSERELLKPLDSQ